MRKYILSTAALALCAAPAAAQQDYGSALTPAPAVATPAAPMPGAPVTPAEITAERTPSLHVSTQSMNEHIRAAAEVRSESERAVMSRGWWYTVAAVAVGAAVALILFN